MPYQEFQPPHELRADIDCFWTRDAHATDSSARSILPDGAIDIIITTGADVSASVVGTMTRAITVAGDASTRYLSVRFKPGRALPYIGIPAAELTNERVPLSVVWADAVRAEETLAQAPDPVVAMKRLGEMLTARRRQYGGPAARDVHRAIDLILATGGNLGIAQLAAEIGVTRQHLARQFSAHVGVSTKTFARVVRFRRALERARLPDSPDWSAIALESGYYDQSHLIDEFRELAGMSPGEWQRLNAPVPFSQDDAGDRSYDAASRS